MPRVSVIVPVYNVEGYVGDCIASLRAQTMGDFQVVCVDDGSTDQSAARARAAAGVDGRFVFVERENGGLSAARNTGLEAATGDYVCFLDSDDWYEPQTLERLCARADADRLDLLDFSARTVYESDEVRKVREEVFDARQPIEGVMSGPELFARYWSTRDYVSSACFHLMSRRLLDDAGLRFCEGVLHEDELFTPVLYAHAKRAALLNEPLYCRRMRADSIMTRPRSLENVRSLFRISRLLHAWLIEHAGACEAPFVDAFAQAISNVRDAASSAFSEIDDAEAERFLDSLDALDRVDFDLTVRYVADQAQARYLDIAGSRAYKLGDALATVPRMVRDRLSGSKGAVSFGPPSTV